MAGAAAGAAGTTVLNAATYLDMALRGRPASRTPENTVTTVAELTHIPIPGTGKTRENRIAGVGALAGLVTGVAAGAAAGAARHLGFRPGPMVSGLTVGLGAMVLSNAPMTALKITDPRSWSVQDWISDVVPHLGYGLVIGATLAWLDSD